MPKISFFTVLMILLFPLFSTAQSAENSTQISLNENNSLTESTTTTDWSFFSDEENQTYYIDFEKINVNLSDVIVKNETGDVLIKDNVYQLPVDTIYEVDLRPYGSGNYSIELRSYTGVIEKKVTIK